MKMTWTDIITGIDQNLPASALYKSPHQDGEIEVFADLVGIDCFCGYSVEFSKRMREHWVESWVCTDTVVGYSVFFLDRTPVAVSIQRGRKSKKEIQFISEEAYDLVRDAVLECLSEDDLPEIPLADLNEEIDLISGGVGGYSRFKE